MEQVRDVVEDGPGVQVRQRHCDARVAQQLELAGLGRLRVRADDGPDLDAQMGEGQRGEQDRATEAPPARIVRDHVPRRRADDQDDR